MRWPVIPVGEDMSSGAPDDGTAAMLFPIEGAWSAVSKHDPRARWLADRHYSRQTIGAFRILPPGRTLVLLTHCARAVWGVACNLDPVGNVRWRCTIFRNEGAGRSSDLIVEATRVTFDYWGRHYGGPPGVPLTTEVDPSKVRRKRDPGRCFVRAGWRCVGVVRGLIVFEAPAGGVG